MSTEHRAQGTGPQRTRAPENWGSVLIVYRKGGTGGKADQLIGGRFLRAPVGEMPAWGVAVCLTDKLRRHYAAAIERGDESFIRLLQVRRSLAEQSTSAAAGEQPRYG